MSQPKTLKDLNLYVEGHGFAGKVTELTLPKLTRKTEDYHAGGMGAPIDMDMGLEKLTASFTLTEFNDTVLRQWGVTSRNGISIRFKGSLGAGRDRAEVPVEVALRGTWNELDWDTWKPGELATLKVSIAVLYYKYTQNSQVVFEIDPVNGIEIVNGVDLLAQRRKNLGL
jgi:P2 family phage contractile tail tube protein